MIVIIIISMMIIMVIMVIISMMIIMIMIISMMIMIISMMMIMMAKAVPQVTDTAGAKWTPLSHIWVETSTNRHHHQNHQKQTNLLIAIFTTSLKSRT